MTTLNVSTHNGAGFVEHSECAFAKLLSCAPGEQTRRLVVTAEIVSHQTKAVSRQQDNLVGLAAVFSAF